MRGQDEIDDRVKKSKQRMVRIVYYLVNLLNYLNLGRLANGKLTRLKMAEDLRSSSVEKTLTKTEQKEKPINSTLRRLESDDVGNQLWNLYCRAKNIKMIEDFCSFLKTILDF